MCTFECAHKVKANTLNLHPTRLITFLFFMLMACGKPLPAFDNLDLEKWRNDKNGCQGERALNLTSLESQKDKLRGLSQDDIVKLLGRPDQNELYKRNQKFFHYLLTPGKECGKDSSSLKLSLRFNAMGFAKEVIVE